MSNSAPSLLRTPFYEFHQQHGAKFVDFAGWEMPLHYGSILEEHRQVRESGGLFDVSHMGRIKFTGRHARRFLEHVLTRRITDMKEKTCRYSLVCNEAGGVLDDVILYRFSDHWLMVVNASNREKLLAHFEKVLSTPLLSESASEGAGNGAAIPAPSSLRSSGAAWAVKIEDQTKSTAMVAVQGPKVMEMIGNFSSEVPTLKRFSFALKNLMILKLTISRTGYTGEDGVEVILPGAMAGMAVKLLLRDREEAAVIKPAGLGARDTLRIEAGLPLYGHELDEQTDPFAAGLGFAVSLDKGGGTGGAGVSPASVSNHDGRDARPTGEGPEIPRFIGQDALEKIKAAGPSKKLIGLAFDGKRTPRQGQDVFLNDQKIGAITSGCLSPTLGQPIAMAYVATTPLLSESASEGAGTALEPGQTLEVAVGSSRLEGKVVELPFYKREK